MCDWAHKGIQGVFTEAKCEGRFQRDFYFWHHSYCPQWPLKKYWLKALQCWLHFQTYVNPLCQVWTTNFKIHCPHLLYAFHAWTKCSVCLTTRGPIFSNTENTIRKYPKYSKSFINSFIEQKVKAGILIWPKLFLITLQVSEGFGETAFRHRIR